MVEPCNEFTWILVMESRWQRLWLWCGRWGETLSGENWRAFPTVCLSFLLCHGKWAVSIMFLGTRCPKGSTSHLPPYTHHENSTLIDNWLQDGRPFSHLLFHDQSYLKIKSRIRRYFSDSSNLEQCLAHNGHLVNRMQKSNFNILVFFQKNFLKKLTLFRRI